MSFFDRHVQRENKETAALIKQCYSVSKVAEALGLRTEIGDECPHCGILALAFHDRRHLAKCPNPQCGAEFDQISLVSERLGLSFNKAVQWIEEHCGRGTGEKAGAAQGDLF